MILSVILFVLLFTIDRITKMIVSGNMELNTSIPIVKDFFYITYVENEGAAFSVLSGERLLLTAVSAFVAAGLIIYYAKIERQKGSLAKRIAIAVILAGAFGNLIDRAIMGRVTDMLHFVFFGYSFAVFNVADICVCCGTAALAFMLMYASNREEKGSRGSDMEP